MAAVGRGRTNQQLSLHRFPLNGARTRNETLPGDRRSDPLKSHNSLLISRKAEEKSQKKQHKLQ